MHATYAIDIVRQREQRAASRAELTARHVAALRAACRRSSGLRGMFGACAHV